MLTLVIVGCSVLVFGLIFLFIVKKKTKIHAIDAVVADSTSNLIHIFGHSVYMPDDSPSYEIYRHYVFDVLNYRFTAGAHQKGKGIDLDSPFVERSLQMLSTKLGRTLKLSTEKRIDAGIRVIRRSIDSSDTEVTGKIPSNAFVVTKLRENDMGLSKVRLEIYRGGIHIRTHEFRGWAEHDFRIYETPFSNQVLMIYSKGGMNFGIALAVIDLTNGDFLFDQFITENKKSQ